MYFEDYSGRDGWMRVGNDSVIIKNIESSHNHLDYEYQISHMFSADDGMIAARFAEENFQSDWLIGHSVSGFENEIEAMTFKLKWI